MPAAEDIYLFRHALLRDAAYELQTPGDRAALHAQAFAVMESVVGLALPAAAIELADHACKGTPHQADLRTKELEYLKIGAKTTESGFRYREALDCLDRIRRHSLLDEEERLKAEIEYAGVAFKLGDYARAHQLLKQLEARFERDGRARELARIRLNLMSALVMNQRYSEAYSEFRESVEETLHELEPGSRATVLNNWSLALKATGRQAEAERLLLEAQADARRGGDVEMADHCLANLANLVKEQGRHREACEIYQQLYARAGERGNRPLQAKLLANMAWSLRSMNDRKGSTAAAHEAAEIARSMGIVPIELMCLRLEAILAKERGDTSTAARLYQEAADRQAELGNYRELAHNLCALASVCALDGQPDEVERHVERLRRLAGLSGDPKVAELAAGARGHRLSSIGDAAGAVAQFQEASRLASTLGDRSGESLWNGNAALAMLRLGNHEQAHRVLLQSVERATALNNLFQRSWWQFGLAVHAELNGDTAAAIDRARAAAQDLRSCVAREGVKTELREFAASIARIEHDTFQQLPLVRQAMLARAEQP